MRPLPIRKAKAEQIRRVDAKALAERAEVLPPLIGRRAQMHAVEQENRRRVGWPGHRIEHVAGAEAEDAALALQRVFQRLRRGQYAAGCHGQRAASDDSAKQRHSARD